MVTLNFNQVFDDRLLGTSRNLPILVARHFSGVKQKAFRGAFHQNNVLLNKLDLVNLLSAGLQPNQHGYDLLCHCTHLEQGYVLVFETDYSIATRT